MAVDQDIDAGTIRLNMELAITKLCHGILTEHELAKSASVETPMLLAPLLKQTERTVPKSDFDYLSVVGSLLHIVNCVRCDASYAVGVLARHANSPGPTHVRAAKRVLQYLYRTRSLGIAYFRPSSGGMSLSCTKELLTRSTMVKISCKRSRTLIMPLIKRAGAPWAMLLCLTEDLLCGPQF